MTLPKKLAEIRDAKAEDLLKSIYRLEPWQEPPDFDFCFKDGFDSCYAELKPRIDDLINALRNTELGHNGFAALKELTDFLEDE